MALSLQQQHNIEASLPVLSKLCSGILPVSLDEISQFVESVPKDKPLEIHNYLLQPSNYYTYPDWNPRSEETRKGYSASVEQFISDSDVMQMINDIEDDPHTKRDLLGLSKILQDIGYDLNHCITTTAYKPKHLICFGTGSGHALKQLLDYLDPSALTIIVSDWEDLYSSFAELDWTSLWNEYCINPQKQINIAQTKEPTAAASTLSMNSLILDHALMFVADSISSDLKKVSEASH